MAATLKDIAEFAGVSVSTASVVIRRDPKLSVSSRTKDRVWEAVRELNYSPNIHARVLSGGRSKLIGLTVLDDYGEVSYNKLRTIQRMIAQKGYSSLLRDAGTNGKDHGICLQDFLHSRVEGIIAVQGLRGIKPEDLKKLKENNIPVISLGYDGNSDHINTVTVDVHKGAYLAVKHLTDLGHRTIGSLLSSINAASITSRVLGCAQALNEAGIKQEQSLWMELPNEMSPATFDSGYECTRALLQRRPDVTAIFCSNDEVAIGAMKAIHDMGMRVPNDISIVGFDNLPMSAYLQVPLTTIAQPTDELVRETVDMMFKAISSKAKSLLKERHLVLAPKLVKRKSTAAPRKNK